MTYKAYNCTLLAFAVSLWKHFFKVILGWCVTLANSSYKGFEAVVDLGEKTERIHGYSHYCRIASFLKKLSRTQLGDNGAAVLKLGSLGESSKSLTTKENRREETVSHS